MNTRLLLIAVAGVVAASAASAQSSLYEASSALLASLSEEQKAEVVLPFNSEERLNWHFIPKQRIGLSFAHFDDAQDKLLLELLKAGLSESGFTKVEVIRSLESVLRRKEGSSFRDPERYHILFFGKPTEDGNWTVRYEGHHLSLNWTFVDGKRVSNSPQFLGANPAEVRIDDPMKGTRALAAEEDLARSLVNALEGEGREKAIIGEDVPRDIFTSNQPKAERLDNSGLPYGEMTADQQGMLLALIEECAGLQPRAISKYRLDKIREAGLDDVVFAWIGSTERGVPHYYRVQGPTFLIEYDNIQNDANHIHIVWRDFEGDFGVDLLREHHTRFFDPAHPGVHRH